MIDLKNKNITAMFEKIKENFDDYNLKARVYPSLIALAPFFLLAYILIKNQAGLNIIASLASSSLITMLLLFFISDIVRNLGKFLESKVFGNELYFPTTEILLHINTYLTAEKRLKIYDKIRSDFQFSLATEVEEKNNENLARQKIKEAVGLVRQKVTNGRLLLQFNIRYGFWRNLIGASLFSCAFCIVDLVIFLLFYTSFASSFIALILFLFYLSIFLFRKLLLKFFGFQYAEQLFLEYLTK